jgi:putative iron-only hydrogenase system regulator
MPVPACCLYLPLGSLLEGFFLEEGMKRIAVASAVLDDPGACQKAFNDTLSGYSGIIRGRMGIPFEKEKISVVSVVLAGELDEINALTGKLGNIPHVTVKTAISGEFIRLTGYHRKSAVRLLSRKPVKEIIIHADKQAVKLKPEKKRPANRKGKRACTDEVIAALRLKGKCLAKPLISLKSRIPIRTFYSGEKRKTPGFWQTDTVHHNKAHTRTFQSLTDIKASVPLPVLEFRSDNGSEFINSAAELWCEQENLPFTRSRDRKKNDNCTQEQGSGRNKLTADKSHDTIVIKANIREGLKWY